LAVMDKRFFALSTSEAVAGSTTGGFAHSNIPFAGFTNPAGGDVGTKAL